MPAAFLTCMVLALILAATLYTAHAIASHMGADEDAGYDGHRTEGMGDARIVPLTTPGPYTTELLIRSQSRAIEQEWAAYNEDDIA